MASRTPPSGTAPPPPPENPLASWYSDFVEKCPIVTRLSISTLFVTYLLSWFLPLESVLSNCPVASISRYQFYRVPISPFLGPGLLVVLFGSLMLFQSGARLERAKGSMRMLAHLAVLSTAAGLLYDAVTLAWDAFGVTSSSAAATCSTGPWILLMALITIECNLNPTQPRRLLCLPVNIPGKYFPFVFTALFAIFGSNILELLCGIAVGYLQTWGLLAFATPSDDRVRGWETDTLRRLAAYPGYVSLEAAAEIDLSAPEGSANQQRVRNERGEGAGSGWVSSLSGAVRPNRLRPVQASGGGGSSVMPQGGGRRLGGGSGSTARPGSMLQTIASAVGVGGTASGAAGPSASRDDPSDAAREAARQARVAAIERRRQQGRSGGARREAAGESEREALRAPDAEDSAEGPEPSAPPARQSLEDGLAALIEMGIDPAEAKRALELCGGDVAAAAEMLRD